MKNLKQYYNIGQLYAITINPIDQYQFYNSKDRFTAFRHLFFTLFQNCHLQYNLYIEMSEPRGMNTQGYKGPRLHMHGTFLFKTKRQLIWFLTYGYNKILKYASLDIDTIADLAQWKSYCTKQKLFKNNTISNIIV